MPSSRRTSPRGAAPRGSSSRTAARGSARPGQRPAPRRSPFDPPAPPTSRSATTAGGRQDAARPRFTGRAALLVLVLSLLVVSYASSLRAYLEQREHLADLRSSIAASRDNLTALKREKRRWDDPAYVEAQARQRFGWVMPGELGFQVIDENGKPLGQQDTLTDPGATPDPDTPEWWETAWGSVVEAGRPHPEPPPATEIRPPRSAKGDR